MSKFANNILRILGFLEMLFIILMCSCGEVETAYVLYVAPDGNDNNPGTKDKPFATLTKARDALRELRITSGKKIVLRGGHYYDVCVELSPEDSNLTIQASENEKPALYGGRLITNWERDGDFYSARLEGAKDRSWDFRILIVNDQLRQRACLPDTGAYTHLSKFDVRWMSTTGGGWQRKPTEKELTTMKYKKGDLGPCLDVNNAELTIFHAWDESVVGLKSLDEKTQTVTFSTPAGHPPGGFGGWLKKANTYIVWNIREGMHHPGQWYLDRTRGRVVYWPMKNENVNEIKVIAPTKENVIKLMEGTKNITIKDLTISCTTTPLIAGGFGAGKFDGALSANKIENCSFINLIIENVGGWGIKTSGAAILIDGCEMRETGAGGFKFNGKNITIRNSHIHDVGKNYPSSIALWGDGNHNKIIHNEIHHTPYSAICYGGDSTLIESNLFYETMKILHDGGAIYITFCRDIIVRGNVVRGSSGTRAHAYYMDEQAENCVVEGNLALNTSWPSHNHMTKNCIIRNNVFIDEGSQLLTFPRSSGMTFERNILMADEIKFSMPTGKPEDPQKGEKVLDIIKPYMKADGITSMPNNILFSWKGKIELEELTAYSGSRTVPFEPFDGTVFTDPLFVDWGKGDFSFKPDSPALKLGIKPIDVSEAGREDRK